MPHHVHYVPRRVAAACTLVLGLQVVSTAFAAKVGPQTDGTSITPQGFKVTPAGQQFDLGPGPLAVALSPRGNLLLVEGAGFEKHQLQVFDSKGVEQQKLIVKDGSYANPDPAISANSPSLYNGLVFSPDGTIAYASDPGGNGIHRFAITGNKLKQAQPIAIGLSAAGGKIYPAGLALSNDGSVIHMVGHLSDELRSYRTGNGTMLAAIPVGHRPYTVVLNTANTRAFVSNWGSNTVSVIDLRTNSVAATVVTGMHPCALAANPLTDEIYVANADSDTVSVLDGQSGAVLRTISLRPSLNAPIGASPNAVAVSPDGKTLYVANGLANDVAVIRLAADRKPDTVEGLIPTGWYPSALAVDAANTTLYVANMKGRGIGPNRDFDVYWVTKLTGSLSRIDLPDTATLARYTAQVNANNAFGKPAVPPPDDSVIPRRAGDPSPIKHVIYVLKENRSYDQILGDLGRGNSDPSLVQWGEAITPNHHALARQFVTFDNFYADAEVSWDGWSWVTGGYANSFTQKNWPLDYGLHGYPDDEGGWDNSELASLPGEKPGDSFFWDKLKEAHIDYVNFGFYVTNPPVVPASLHGLQGHTDSLYPGWDLDTWDNARIDRWLEVFKSYLREQRMPAVQFVYLPSDHTNGAGTEGHRPYDYLADNDRALGRLVDAVSHSPFWKDTAIFVAEDDAQDGFDHVDGHRSIAFVISPYTQTGAVDSSLYSNVSMLRTMELILGVTPMTQFDASALSMAAAFASTPRLDGYTALTPDTSTVPNPNAEKDWALLEARTATLDLSKPDRIDMALMNEILWKSVKGVNAKLPELKRAAFVRAARDDGE